MAVKLMKRDIGAEAETYLKREFSADDRKRLAASGAAMPGGEYPIENVADLRNAVRAIGRAKDPAATRRHIISRARSLDAVSELPESWKVTKRSALAAVLEAIGLKKQASDFETVQANAEAAEFAQGMLAEFDEATCSLRDSISAIMCDATVADKQAAIEGTIKQFQDHIAGVVPEGIEQAMRGAALAAQGYKLNDQGAVTKGATMTDAEKAEMEKTKAEAEKAKAEKEKAEKALAVSKREVAVLKMSDKHKAYMAARGDDMKQEERDKFADMEPGERDAHMDKHPVPEDAEKKLNEAVTKALNVHPEVVALRKRVEAAEAVNKLAEFRKRAVELGLSEDFGEVIQKARAGDEASVKKLEEALAAATKANAEGEIFKEFGSRGGEALSDDAVTELQKKAEELRKKDTKLSAEQAFAKAYADPANASLVRKERKQNRPAAA